MESHFTATGFVLNLKRDRALLVFHKKLRLWLPAGGHVEQGELPHEAALREVYEETGVKAHIRDASPALALSSGNEVQIPAPFFVLHEPIPQYKDKEAHMHYDFLYSMQAEADEIQKNELENDSVAWLCRDDFAGLDTTEATKKIYTLLLDGLYRF